MAKVENVQDAASQAMVTALSAVGWIVQDPVRADRLLALTGLSPSNLRESLGDPSLLAAMLQFLEAHEPDLVACADALEIEPSALVEARAMLETQSP